VELGEGFILSAYGYKAGDEIVLLEHSPMITAGYGSGTGDIRFLPHTGKRPRPKNYKYRSRFKYYSNGYC
jgi:hypothetical protein